MTIVGAAFNAYATQAGVNLRGPRPTPQGPTNPVSSGPIGSSAPEIGISENPSGATPVGDRFTDFVNSVDQQMERADAAQREFANGRSNDIHGTMIQMQKADIEFRLLASVRNKAIDAYREIMRMGA